MGEVAGSEVADSAVGVRVAVETGEAAMVVGKAAAATAAAATAAGMAEAGLGVGVRVEAMEVVVWEVGETAEEATAAVVAARTSHRTRASSPSLAAVSTGRCGASRRWRVVP